MMVVSKISFNIISSYINLEKIVQRQSQKQDKIILKYRNHIPSMIFYYITSHLILSTKLTGGGSPSLLSWSDPEDPTEARVFMGFESVSLSLESPPSPSSSLDHTHSPVSFLWRRPEAPGCLFDACGAKKLISKLPFHQLVWLTFWTRVSKLGPMATNVCCRYFLSFAFLKKGCLSSSAAVGLFAGSFWRQSVIIFLNVFPYAYKKTFYHHAIIKWTSLSLPCTDLFLRPRYPGLEDRSVVSA